ncbi:LYR motif-containing protein 4 [Spatholobus suberectus]|nr:LYR motif-containing protein 4 [Spatholobus suberectus]
MSAASSATPSAAQVLSLFRSLLRVAREFPDYNIREYAKRRTVDAFREHATLSDPSATASAFSHGKSQLAVVKRQAVVHSLYAPQLRSVMELLQPPF